MIRVFTPLLLLRVALLVCILSGAQTRLLGQRKSAYRPLTTAKDMVVADTISGQNLSIYLINPLAKHGTVSIQNLTPGGNPFTYRIAYTPDPGFVGIDTFEIEMNYIATYPFLIYRGYEVKVFPSLLDARYDYATTPAGTPITIPVLNNDIGSLLPLTLLEVTATNHGTASISTNEVVFTPDAGYVGPAHLNYTVRDAQNNVKTGSVTVMVQATPTPVNDTIQVLTARNVPVSMPLEFGGYTLFSAPTQGDLVLNATGQSFRYSPYFNVTGQDEFVLTQTVNGQPVYKTVKVHTVSAPTPNTMAMDDYIYTPRGQAVSFNVRTNDIGNLLVRGWTIPTTLPGAVSGTNGVGDATFTPNPNYNGVATFQYRVGNSDVPNLEVANIHVIVSDLPPARSLYELTTPVGTPLVINYKIPYTGFEFTVTDAPDNGNTDYWPGFSSQNINGNNVSGFNILTYTPNAGFVGLDEFEVNYCVNGRCSLIKIQVNVTPVIATNGPYCIGEPCVWAGDANNDGVVNNHDLLPIGYHMGMQGATRPDASYEWYGQYSPNWNNPFGHVRHDLKHIDSDGNGTITPADTAAIGLFYGQVHEITPRIPPVSKGLPFFLNFLTPNAGPGDLCQIEVSLGSPSLPVTDLYGFTWDARISPQIIDSAFSMTFFDNSWINRNSPFLTLAQRPSTGLFQTAFTRTSGVSASGYGLIARADFIIVDVVIGARPEALRAAPRMTIEGEYMTADGTVAHFSQDVEIPLALPFASGNKSVQVSSTDLLVYPSPANTQIEVHLNGRDLMEQITVADLTGQIVWQSDDQLQAEHRQINVQDWPTGTYIVITRTQSGQVSRKIQVIH
jgi:Secretion system C-terminal sorting domain/Bacterial Ig domain